MMGLSKAGLRFVTAFFLIAALFIAAPISGALAALTTPAPKTIRVGYIRNYGMGTEDSPEMYGYTYDYLMKIAELTGFEYEFVECTGTNYFPRLESGEIDLVGPLQYDDDRATRYQYSALAMDYGFQYLVADNGSGLYYDDFNAFDGMLVGLTHGDFYKETVNQYANKNRFSVEFTIADGKNIAGQLKDGVYDAAVITSILYLPGVEVIGKIGTVPFYFAAVKENGDIMDAIDRAMREIASDDPYFAGKLHEKYYGNMSMAPPAYTRQESAFIQSAAPLRVVSSCDWPPFEQRRGNSGACEGINVDILKHICENSGLAMKFIPTRNYLEGLRMVSQGEADLILGDSELYRDAFLLYSDVYLETPMILASRKPIEMSKPLTIAIAGLEPGVYSQIVKKYPRFAFKSYGDKAAVSASVRSGAEDAAIMSMYAFNEMVLKESSRAYYTIPLADTLPLRVGIGRHVDPLVAKVINTTIRRLSTEERAAIVFSNTSKREFISSFVILLKENLGLAALIISLLFGGILAAVVTNYRNHKKAIETIAYVDALTGLRTKAKFDLDAVAALKTARPGAYMLISMDVNNFKYINSIFGYQTGDQILRAIGQFFQGQGEQAGIFARTSADNFLLLIKSRPYDYFAETIQLENELDNYLKREVPIDFHVTFCCGIYEIDDPESCLDSMIDNANLARKSIKGTHAHSFAVYSEAMGRTLEADREIVTSMEQALVNREFEVYLQPKVCLITGKVFGAEALARWNRPNQPMIMPDQFIPIFERNGFIQKLDICMFEQVCALLARWRAEYPAVEPPIISVNLSRYCIGYRNLSEELKRTAKQYGIEQGQIELELTESIAINDLSHLKTVIGLLKNAGFQISIDDFGSGYSSLALLTQLPADVIKIDRAFLSGNHGSGSEREVVYEIIQLIRSLNMKTVAEGVETEEQAEALRSSGCDLAQGYLFGRPMPIAQYEAEYMKYPS